MRYLSALNPRWDLDAHLNRYTTTTKEDEESSSSQQQQDHHHQQEARRAVGDFTAYTTFLQTTAPPLLALSLYVSSANWAATTRPAFSALLPFPLTWTEPPALRNRMCDVAAHLGLSDLNIDAAGESDGNNSSTDDRGFLKIPERLRPGGPRGVRAALSPEQTALFRLEAAAGQGCLAVLEDLKRRGEIDGRRFFFSSSSAATVSDEDGYEAVGNQAERPTSLDCLAFAYLALMLVPEVPRPWLRDLIRRRYECLSLFVDGIRDEIFGGDVVEGDCLPWAYLSPSSSASTHHQPWTLTRFARGVFTAIIPGEYLMPREGKYKNTSKQKTQTKAAASRKLLGALVKSFAGMSVIGGICGLILHRQHLLQPFGATVYRWEVQRRRFGAAGAFFGI